MFKSDSDTKLSTISNIKNGHETIIGPSVKVEGNFRGDGDVYIEGEVKGSIKTKGDVHVGSQANIKASIEAGNITVAGQIQGNIKARDQLKLEATARVQGDLTVKSLQIDSGAQMNGQVKMDDGTTSKEEPNLDSTDPAFDEPGTEAIFDRRNKKK